MLLPLDGTRVIGAVGRCVNLGLTRGLAVHIPECLSKTRTRESTLECYNHCEKLGNHLTVQQRLG